MVTCSSPKRHGLACWASARRRSTALAEIRGRAGGKPRRRSPVSAAVRRSVPVRTFSDWQDPPPGFVEADLVAHSGPSASGSFIQTLVVTDIATGWTECAPLLVREQGLLTEVLTEIRKLVAVRSARLRYGQRQCVHERDRPGLLCDRWHRIHAL